MAKYEVKLGFSGYSRGFDYFIVEADSAQEAIENWYDGEHIDRETVRDDTERDDSAATADII